MSDQRLDNIERRLALEARARKNIQVTGGNNVLVSKFGDDFILDAIDEEGSTDNDCFQWNVIFKGGSSESKTACLPYGRINGLFPDNKDEVGEVNKDDEETWLWLEVQFDGVNIESASYKLGSTKPDTLFEMHKEPPTNVQILIAFIGLNYSVQKFTRCGDMRLFPKIGYYAYDDSAKEIIPWHTHDLYYH